jgi:ligand-binding SRPBCC domain-containing protein
MPHHLEFADWVPHPVPQVFSFFSNPQNLPRLMPPETHTRLDRLELTRPAAPSPGARSAPHAAGAGSILFTSFRPVSWLPLRQTWIARIVEFEWNHHFADVQQEGPFKSWHHRHEFLADSRQGVNGTLVRDVIDYEVGMGPLGKLANALFVANQIRSMFAARQKALPGLLSASS